MNTMDEMRRKIRHYIIGKDFFWLHDLKEYLDITDNDSRECSYVSKICTELYRDGVLMPCERKGNHIQYMKI